MTRHACAALTLSLAALTLAGCASGPAMVYVRTDGRPIATPELNQQFEVDRTVCTGQRSGSAVSAPYDYSSGLGNQIVNSMERSGNLDNVMRGCMAQRGYLLRAAAPQVAVPQSPPVAPGYSAPPAPSDVAPPAYGRTTPPVERPGRMSEYRDRLSDTPGFAPGDAIGY